MNVRIIIQRRWPALVALAGALALFFAFASTSRAQQGQLTGTLNILHGDPVRAPGIARNTPQRQPFYRYFLADDRGRETELAIDDGVIERAGGIGALDGRRVSVTLAAGPVTAAAGPSR